MVLIYRTVTFERGMSNFENEGGSPHLGASFKIEGGGEPVPGASYG